MCQKTFEKRFVATGVYFKLFFIFLTCLILSISCNPSDPAGIILPEKEECKPPVFSVEPGQYKEEQLITITSAQPQAVIYYTVDGSNPLIEGIRYSKGEIIKVSCNQTLTIRAYSVLEGTGRSSVVWGTYKVTGKISKPVFEIFPGNDNKLRIVLKCIPKEARIIYTDDGSDPSREHGYLFNPKDPDSPSEYEALLIDKAQTIRAFAYLDGWEDSEISEQTYTLRINTPVFDPPEGVYEYDQQVKIMCGIKGARVYYNKSEKGIDPAAVPNIDDEKSAFLYTGEFIKLTRPMVIKTRAFQDNWEPSEQAQAIYKVHLPAPECNPPADPADSGVTYQNTEHITLTCKVPEAQIFYTTDGNEPTEKSLPYKKGSTIPVSSTTTIRARAFINEEGWLSSPVSTNIYNFNLKAPEIYPRGGTYYDSQKIEIKGAANQNVTIYFTTDGSDPADETNTNRVLFSGAFFLNGSDGRYMASNQITNKGELVLKAVAIADGMTQSKIITEEYLFKLNSPTESNNSGVNSKKFDVRLEHEKKGSVIYYSIDGNKKKHIYSKPIEVTGSLVLHAYAAMDHWADSEMIERSYLFKPAAPHIVDANNVKIGETGTVFHRDQNITFYCSTEGAVIYYTLNGEDPKKVTDSKWLYTAAHGDQILLKETAVIRAYAKKDGWDDSDSTIARCIFKVPQPVIEPGGGIIKEGSKVTITCQETNGVTIKYTTDGTNPKTSASAQVVLPVQKITIDRNRQIRAYAAKQNWHASEITTADFKVQVSRPDFLASYNKLQNEDKIETFDANTNIRTFTYSLIDEPSPANPISTEIKTETTGSIGIQYSIGGSDPTTTDSPIYFPRSTIKVLKPETLIKAYARDETSPPTKMPSEVGSALFRFKVMTPSFGKLDFDTSTLAVSSPTKEITYHYTITGRDGKKISDGAFTKGTIPLPMVGYFTVETWASRANWVDSDRIVKDVRRQVFAPEPGAAIDFTHNKLQVTNIEPGAVAHYSMIDASGDVLTGDVSSDGFINNLPLVSPLNVKVWATRDGWVNSEVVEKSYTNKLPAPVIICNIDGNSGEPDDKPNSSDSKIRIFFDYPVEGGEIWFILNNDTKEIKYDPATDIIITKSTKIRCYAKKPEWIESEVSERDIPVQFCENATFICDYQGDAHQYYIMTFINNETKPGSRMYYFISLTNAQPDSTDWIEITEKNYTFDSYRDNFYVHVKVTAPGMAADWRWYGYYDGW